MICTNTVTIIYENLKILITTDSLNIGVTQEGYVLKIVSERMQRELPALSSSSSQLRATSADVLWLTTGGILLVSKDAAKHPKCTEQSPTAMSYLTSNMNNARVEKLQSVALCGHHHHHSSPPEECERAESSAFF